ncbi:hypothetical protein Drorol1_Dr00017896 [Drosera rotundifolia]
MSRMSSSDWDSESSVISSSSQDSDSPCCFFPLPIFARVDLGGCFFFLALLALVEAAPKACLVNLLPPVGFFGGGLFFYFGASFSLSSYGFLYISTSSSVRFLSGLVVGKRSSSSSS